MGWDTVTGRHGRAVFSAPYGLDNGLLLPIQVQKQIIMSQNNWNRWLHLRKFLMDVLGENYFIVFFFLRFLSFMSVYV